MNRVAIYAVWGLLLLSIGVGYAAYTGTAYLIPRPQEFGSSYVEVQAQDRLLVLIGGVRPEGPIEDAVRIDIYDLIDEAQLDTYPAINGKFLLLVEFTATQSLDYPLRLALVLMPGEEQQAQVYALSSGKDKWEQRDVIRQDDQNLITFELERLSPLLITLP